jgi:hypothetical protein
MTPLGTYNQLLHQEHLVAQFYQAHGFQEALVYPRVL